MKKEWYLDHRMVRPGDILVTMGRALRSKLIAVTTRDRFSHAALCVAPTLLYEADGEGVYPTPLPFTCFEDSGGQHRVGLHLHDIARAALLRHDSIAARLQREYYDVLDDFAEKAALLFGMPYSKLGRLLSALPNGTPLQRLGERYEQHLTRAGLSPKDRGLFCSELVSAIYSDLHTPLFQSLPATVSPGALFSKSTLREIKDAVLQGIPRKCSPEKAALADGATSALGSRRGTIDSDRKIRGMQAQSEKSIKDMGKHGKRR